ncbi:hypothetical protein NDU88_001115 [Pleurodeles waltl]|uniref:Uncharacterized protein n=1 Tax=Pleurodeles waltl TaxID=8319 RepID=A0AAV7V6Y8_PLEWA|nr:hypothetical protein NDU88_001115 [Pleurodeles waltl]
MDGSRASILTLDQHDLREYSDVSGNGDEELPSTSTGGNGVVDVLQDTSDLMMDYDDQWYSLEKGKILDE